MNHCITDAASLPAFLMCPRPLLEMDLTRSELIVYLLLLDRARLSARHKGWRDGLGQVYVIYPVRELAQDADRGETCIKKALSGLAERDLIERWRRGLGKPNRIFVKVPEP